MNVEQIYYAQWLLSLYELSNKAIRIIQEKVPDPNELFRLPKEQLEMFLPPQYAQVLWKKCQEGLRSHGSGQEHVKCLFEALERRGMHFVAMGQPEYPARLTKIPDPPLGLYYSGKLPSDKSLSVAIIGSRECSEYGRHVAETLGRFLGERGAPVISGMARGVDGISQQAALLAGGESYGVLGCGVDVCYPKSNQKLYQTLTQHGGILSEYPPGTPPLAANFPVRNRIVSGLANAVVVVEAALKSGTSITVSLALDQGRDVYVVPGRVTDRLSDGCNQLIKQGAAVYTDPESFLEEIQQTFFLQSMGPKASVRPISGTAPALSSHSKDSDEGALGPTHDAKDDAKPSEPYGLPERLKIIWRVLDHTPKSVEEIQKDLSETISVQECTIRLMELVLTGKAKQVTTGQFVRQ
jgi:DNA protecting protein DprA